MRKFPHWMPFQPIITFISLLPTASCLTYPTSSPSRTPFPPPFILMTVLLGGVLLVSTVTSILWLLKVLGTTFQTSQWVPLWTRSSEKGFDEVCRSLIKCNERPYPQRVCYLQLRCPPSRAGVHQQFGSLQPPSYGNLQLARSKCTSEPGHSGGPVVIHFNHEGVATCLQIGEACLWCFGFSNLR